MRMRRVKDVDKKLSEVKILREMKDLENWKSIFDKKATIHLECGMGKGDFLAEKSKRHKDINFIGVDRSDMAILKASKKFEDSTNVRLFVANVEELIECLPDKSIDVLYLNFSDPWPKKRHYKRRLTYRDYLKNYDRVIKDGGHIELKTDNEALFQFTREELMYVSWKEAASTTDYYRDSIFSEHVKTEYEEKFHRQGCPIYALLIKREL